MLRTSKAIQLAATVAAIAAVTGCGGVSDSRPHPPASLTINAASTTTAPTGARYAAARFTRAYARSADGREPADAAVVPAIARELRATAQGNRGNRSLPPLGFVALSVVRVRARAVAGVATFRPGPGLPFRVGFTVERVGQRWRVSEVDGTGAER
jgi:hypothetical protein